MDLAARNIWTVPLVVVDTETTGLSHETGDQIIEIALIRATTLSDERPSTQSWLVRPDISVPTRATAIHGIDDTMLRDSPQYPAIAMDVQRTLKDAVCVAHNAAFDTGFINATCDHYSIDRPEYGPIIDTVKLARSHFGFPSCSLKNLTERMELPLDNHHRARSDAYATYLLFQTMMKTIDPDQNLTVRELLTLTDSLGPKGMARKAMKYQLRQAVRDNLDVEIDYTRVRGPGGLTATRRLSAVSVDFPKVKAWCHLRNDERVFWIDRIHRVQLLGANLQAQSTISGA